MNDDLLQDYIKQHYDNYKNAILELIDNNTSVLFDDILLLIKKPPLDSMDSVRNRFLEVSKKYKVVINTEELNKFLDYYRQQMLSSFEEIKMMRLKSLNNLVNSFKNDEIIVLYKKDFIPINKEIKGYLKKKISESIDNCMNIYSDKLINIIDVNLKSLYFKEILKYFKGNYQRYLIDSFDIKILVKDTTLMNSVKEQNDHYIFTLNNSRLLNL